MNKPSAIGTITICTIDINISIGLKAILFPINNNVIIGVNNGEIIVETAVSVTDNARSPFARNVITSDAVPPGTVPTSIKPTVNASFNENIFAKHKASSGIMIYCVEIPTMTSLGLLNTFTKLSTLSVVPIPKSIIPNNRLMVFVP